MAFQPLSVGDIMMLSTTAWKIGRAFTAGRDSAPAEFAEVESEANGLSDALKLAADALHEDGSILDRAEPETRSAVNEILDSAGRTLRDLESFIEKYQVIKKRATQGGWVVERTWSDAVIANYKTFKWTTEGGDITKLRDVLQMHTNTLNLTMQALQSRSLARLERAVIPIAENITSIHDRVNGDLGDKIDDLHRIIMSIANSTPSLVARDRRIEDGASIARSSSSNSVPMLQAVDNDAANSDMIIPLALASRQPPALPPKSPARDISQSVAIPNRPRKTSSRVDSKLDWDFEAGSPPRARGGGSALDDSPSSPWDLPHSTPRSIDSSLRDLELSTRESNTLSSHFESIREGDAAPGAAKPAVGKRNRHVSQDKDATPITVARTNSQKSSEGDFILPPPAVASSSEVHTPATPSSVFSQGNRPQTAASTTSNAPRKTQSTRSSQSGIPPSPSISTLAAFEKSLFRNAATLCDVRGTLVEYATHNLDEPDPRYATEMVEACKGARIRVVSKRENREHGGTKVVTSVWTLSDDGSFRCQQKLADFAETVPYCSFFQPEKVSLGEVEMFLKLHGEKWGDMPQKEIKTNWVNYIFESERDSAEFQSAVFGRVLLGSFHTKKSTVVHEGLKGAFAFEEQFANIEMLRLWEENGLSIPGADGGVLALMHVSSNFGEGWARWWVNNSRQHVRVKGDGSKVAKLKGIDVTVVKPGVSQIAADKIRVASVASDGMHRSDSKGAIGAMGSTKSSPTRKVAGIRIEFKTEEEKTKFLGMCRQAQQKMYTLPDL